MLRCVEAKPLSRMNSLPQYLRSVITRGSELAREEAGTSAYISGDRTIAFASKLAPTGIDCAWGLRGCGPT